MINKKYKDRLFCLLFGNEEYKDNILSLYNALCNTSYMMILENLAIADNKGKTYGLGRGTNHARIDAYKEAIQVDDILGTFNEISIECGN